MLRTKLAALDKRCTNVSQRGATNRDEASCLQRLIAFGHSSD
jgi:hypothetical protein